jgi:hypothetical protein
LLSNKNIIIMVAIYISPNQKMADIIKFIHKAFLVYSHEGAALYGGDEDTCAMVMSGDFNVNFASSDSAPLVTLLRDKFCLQLNNDPTISTTKSGTTIDAIYDVFCPKCLPINLQLIVLGQAFEKDLTKFKEKDLQIISIMRGKKIK